MKKFILTVILFTGLLFAVSCSSGSDSENISDKSDTGSGDTGDTVGDTGSGDTGNTGNTGGDTGEAGDTGDTADTGDTGDAGDTGDTGNSGDTGDSGDTESPDDDVPDQSGQITAAKWNDIDNWDFWLGLLNNDTYEKYLSDWGIVNFYKIDVLVNDGELPAVDATVKLKDGSGKELWVSKSDNKGMAYLYVLPFDKLEYEGDLTVEVKYGPDESVQTGVYDGENGLEFTFDDNSKVEDILDLMFVIDTTGSMSDELDYLKVELLDVIDRVAENYEQSLKVRLSVNFYRDLGDEYVVRSFPFSTNISSQVSNLSAQSSSGGGDRPEAVHTALTNAIDEHDWSAEARARIMFIILDAPPHIEKQEVPVSIRNSIRKAASKGIRIIPIAASGIEKSDEFLLRAMDILTGGEYIFITDDSGIGGDHIEPTVGEYEVEYLNDLLVRTISGYLE